MKTLFTYHDPDDKSGGVWLLVFFALGIAAVVFALYGPAPTADDPVCPTVNTYYC